MEQQLMNGSIKSHVVAMPYPGRGHINPMLNLCNSLLISSSSSSHHLLITFVVTQEWLGFLKAERRQPLPANFRFATIPQVIPSEIGRAADFSGFYEATATKLAEPFEKLLDQLHPPPTAIIYDTYLTWVVHVANRRNIHVASLFTMSPSVFTFLLHFDLLQHNRHFPLDLSDRGNEVVDYIPGLPPTAIKDMPGFFEGEGRKVLHRVLQGITAATKAHHLLFTSVYEIEQQVIDCLKAKLPLQIHHIGPLIPYLNLQQSNGANSHASDQTYFQWLDAQPQDSVLYVSQGSFLSVSSAQMDEIVAGMKESGVRYLWVTRGDSSRFNDDGPGEMGFLVPWCDQLKVLCHPSVGGFWTHCGWNSTSEGVYAGVPMLTCPIFWDQIPNSKLIVSDWKIGTRVMDNGMSGKLVTRLEIARLVSNFMDSKSEKRKGMVTRAKNLSNVVKRAFADGGSASTDLHAFIRSIS